MTSASVPVPEALRRNAVQVWGERGRAWLDDLPRLVDDLARRWDLEVGDPFVLSFHWVASCRRRDGSAAVLKLGVPGEAHLAREAAVLGRWDGRGAVRLLDLDLDHGALLLERADPGTMAAGLVPHDDETATRAVLHVARRLHEADPAGLDLRDIASERASLDAHLVTHGAADPLPAGQVARAAALLDELGASRSRVVLLHGDLHHDNVLRHASCEAGWAAIDPHGWVGDPGFEVGPLLYNPIGSDPALLVRLLPRRLEVAAEVLGEPLDRLRAWGYVAAVVSQVWSCEDGGAPEAAPGAVAEALTPR